jgi:hypothetical protein
MSAPRGREKRGREKTARTMRTITFVSHLFFVILVFYFSASGGGVSGQEDDGEDNNDDDGTNTFWNTGPSGIDETLLPPLNPTNYPCPTDRYLLLGPRTYTGGFNNMFMTFQSAILLARYTNRTFVIPAARNDRYTDFRFSQAIDYEVRRRDHVFFLSFFRFVSSSRSVCVCLCFFHVASRDGIQYLTFNVLSLLLFLRVRF